MYCIEGGLWSFNCAFSISHKHTLYFSLLSNKHFPIASNKMPQNALLVLLSNQFQFHFLK